MQAPQNRRDFAIWDHNLKETRNVTRMSDEAVRAKTGKIWVQWFEILDKAGAKKMNHQEIVTCLRKEHGVGPWWQQMMTVAYEQERGLREKHQKPDGFQISVSKTIPVAISALYGAWQDKNQRGRWLPKVNFAIRKATKNKCMRITRVNDKTNLLVNFYAKGKNKSLIVVEHSKLPDGAAAAKQKSYWAKALNRLANHLSVPQEESRN